MMQKIEGFDESLYNIFLKNIENTVFTSVIERGTIRVYGSYSPDLEKFNSEYYLLSMKNYNFNETFLKKRYIEKSFLPHKFDITKLRYVLNLQYAFILSKEHRKFTEIMISLVDRKAKIERIINEI